MNATIRRRTLLAAASVLPLAGACTVGAARAPQAAYADAQARLAALERDCGGRLGVHALDTGDEASIAYRANELFPMCSTFKLMASSAILQRSAAQEPGLLERRVRYAKGDLVPNSPITEKHVADGMTVAELCAATLRYSDNTAANQLMRILGGPAAVTAYARSVGDTVFRLDRWETELNSAIPGDPRDTTSPAAMAASARRLVLGDALGAPQREQLRAWLLGNTTGKERFLAGVPAGWRVADKTGAGSYGTNNDVGVLWPASGAPLVLAVYLTFPGDKDAPLRNEVVASAARIVAQAFRG